jgi:hypothetical protein
MAIMCTLYAQCTLHSMFIVRVYVKLRDNMHSLHKFKPSCKA